MRVLWFTNMPLLPVYRYLGFSNVLTSGTWMDSLRLVLEDHPEVELAVASQSHFRYENFTDHHAAYFNIKTPPPNGSIRAVYRRWQHNPEVQNLLDQSLSVIDQFQPDLIHIHGTEDFFGLIARQVQKPIVISIQGILSVIEKKFFGGYTCQEILFDSFSSRFLRGTSLLHEYVNIKNSARREREITKLCKYFIGRTEFDKNFITLMNPGSSYYHCDDVLRAPFYATQWNGEFDKKPVVYTTTGPAPLKGLDCLLNSIALLKANGFQNIQLRVSGSIQDAETWPNIKRRVEALHLQNEIVWLGRCTADEIAQELARANVYVLPSYIENASCALGEAMLVGTPCIASYVGGVPSEIRHGIDGLFFPSGDDYSLAGMIAKIIRDPILAQSLSKNARVRALERHHPQTIGAKMVNIYGDILHHEMSEQ